MGVFADTWYYVALLDERDQNHERATQHAYELTQIQVTTRWILAEVANMLCTPRTRLAAAAFLRKLGSLPIVRVIDDSDDLFERGQLLYERRPDKEWSLTDCISFAVMEREGLREALTGDHHFHQAGFVPVFLDRA